VRSAGEYAIMKSACRLVILSVFILISIACSMVENQTNIEFYVIGFGVTNGSSDENLLKSFAGMDMNGKYIPAEDASTPEKLEKAIFDVIDPSTIVNSVEIRGPMSEVRNGANYIWGSQEFPGLYYDIDKGTGNESINLKIADNTLNEKDGIIYTTSAQKDNFKFRDWGEYWNIGFLGENYFAGYVDNDNYYLYKDSEDANLMLDEKLSPILEDQKDEYIFTSGSPLKLKEGYELMIQSIDSKGGKVYVELRKNGNTVDTSIVEPSKDGASEADKTYTYNKNIGSTKKLVVIAVHFKDAFRSANLDLATVDGIWQISDSQVDIKTGTKYDKMTLKIVDPYQKYIMMNNSDYKILLQRNRDVSIMGNIRIKTADQKNINDNEPLRFYIYKKLTQPGTYEVRSSIAKVEDGATIEWNRTNFARFYYDMDKNLGDQNIVMKISGDALDEPDGIVFTTKAQKTKFALDDWGDYWKIGLLDKAYFTAYSDDSCPYKSDNKNLLESGQLAPILIDDDDEHSLGTGSVLPLKEGYEIRTKEIDKNGKVKLDLAKDGEVVDESAIVDPSKNGATEKDKTYVYKSDLGDLDDVVTIAVHFRNAMAGSEQSIATIDGVWQISDKAVDFKEGTKYGTLTVKSIDPGSKQIVMNNKNDRISLRKDREITLMDNIRMKTSDQDAISAEEPLRFYIFEKMAIIYPTSTEKT
jgi:S-layer protein (TIGR01567 family)